MREALSKEAKEGFDKWKVEQGQLNEVADFALANKRAEEDAAHREALITATESEKTILNLKQSQLEISRKSYDEVVKERRTLMELEKLKELGIEQAEGYNIDQAIALSKQKIAEIEINHAREQRLMMAEKELEIHKSLMEKSKALIGAEFGSSITLPKTEIDEFAASLKTLNEEQLKNTEEIATQIQAIDDFIAATPDMDKERMAEQLQAKADLERKHQMNALDADRKRAYVEGKTSIATQSTALGKESARHVVADDIAQRGYV